MILLHIYVYLQYKNGNATTVYVLFVLFLNFYIQNDDLVLPLFASSKTLAKLLHIQHIMTVFNLYLASSNLKD